MFRNILIFVTILFFVSACGNKKKHKPSKPQGNPTVTQGTVTKEPPKTTKTDDKSEEPIDPRAVAIVSDHDDGGSQLSPLSQTGDFNDVPSVSVDPLSAKKTSLGTTNDVVVLSKNSTHSTSKDHLFKEDCQCTERESEASKWNPNQPILCEFDIDIMKVEKRNFGAIEYTIASCSQDVLNKEYDVKVTIRSKKFKKVRSENHKVLTKKYDSYILSLSNVVLQNMVNMAQLNLVYKVQKETIEIRKDVGDATIFEESDVIKGTELRDDDHSIVIPLSQDSKWNRLLEDGDLIRINLL